LPDICLFGPNSYLRTRYWQRGIIDKIIIKLTTYLFKRLPLDGLKINGEKAYWEIIPIGGRQVA